MKNNLKIAACFTLHALLLITWICLIFTNNILSNASLTMIFTAANLVFCLIETRIVNRKRDDS